jgi:hypothetical protein
MASSLAAVGCQEGFEGYLGAIAAQVRAERGTTQRNGGSQSCAAALFDQLAAA